MKGGAYFSAKVCIHLQAGCKKKARRWELVGKLISVELAQCKSNMICKDNGINGSIAWQGEDSSKKSPSMHSAWLMAYNVR